EPPRRLHAHSQAGAAQGRRRRDGHSRAGGSRGVSSARMPAAEVDANTAVRYRATRADDGTAYQGFQRQGGDTPTIQAALEKALLAVTGQPVTVIAAGRTDSGVHAVGQVIAFDVVWKHGDDDLLRAINAVLPDDIALQDLRQQAGFHPRYDAVARVYKYHLVQIGRAHV